MGQLNFAKTEYATKRKKTPREVSLEEIELVVPRKDLVKGITPFYPVSG